MKRECVKMKVWGDISEHRYLKRSRDDFPLYSFNYAIYV